MLQQMRDWFRYLKWILLVIVVMFVWWAFAAWSGGASGGRQQEEVSWAAKVNGTTIDLATFQSSARQMEATYRSLFGDQFSQQRGLIKVGQAAINQLIDEELLYQAAESAGLSVSQDEVADAITHEPSLQENGRFIGLDRYRNIFKAARISVEEFEEHIRRRLLVDKYRDLLGNGVAVSDSEVEQEFLKRNLRTSVDWVMIDPAAVTDVTRPVESDLTSWYEGHKERYRRGEGRDGLYLLVHPGDLASPSSVTDADARAAYDRDLQARYAVREQRRASHILFKVPPGASDKDSAAIEAKARQILKKAKSGEDFAALARRYSEDSTASAGGDLGFFGRGQMAKEFEDAAFSLPIGSVSDPVRTTFGFHIIKVVGEHPPHTVAFDEVKETIRGEIAAARGRALALDKAAALAKAAADGRLEAAAQAQGLKALPTGPVRAGDSIPQLTASQPAVTRMLGLQPGQTSEPIPTPAGMVIVQVTAVVPDEPAPFAEVRNKIEKEVLDQRRQVAVRARVRASAGLAALAKSYKLEVKHQDDLTRGASLPGVPRDEAVDRQLETLAPGVPGDPIVTPSGIVVLLIRERKDHREEMAAQKDSTRDTLLSQQRERLLRAVVQRLREAGSVSINTPVVDAIDRT
jgi:peptidyl-prolyl cis-trans isomerase D